MIARIAHDAAGAAAMRAGLLQSEKTLRDAHLAVATAGVAGRGGRALGGAGAVADLALVQFVGLDFNRAAEYRVGQIELDLIAQIGAAKCLRAAAATASAAEDVAEHIAKDVAEGLRAVEAATARRRVAAGLQSSVAMLIVDGALRGI